MRVVQHPEAAAELIEASRYYEQSVRTLGVQFLEAVEEAVAKIAAGPERWPIMEDEIRRFLMWRFPYAIYYRIYPDHIRILAFKHHSRHPGYWHGRAEG